jgi:hypothetical protein
MKFPQDQTLVVHAFITATFALVCLALIIFSHNATATNFAIAALPSLYLLWTPSPAQQSANASLTTLLQKLVPLIESLLQQPPSQNTNAQKVSIEPIEIQQPQKEATSSSETYVRPATIQNDQQNTH